MKREDVIRIAKEVYAPHVFSEHGLVLLERFATLVAAAEREACAKACDNLIMYGPVAEVQQRYNKAYADCRDKIRDRGIS